MNNQTLDIFPDSYHGQSTKVSLESTNKNLGIIHLEFPNKRCSFKKKSIHPNLIDNPGYIIFRAFQHWPTSSVPTFSTKLSTSKKRSTCHPSVDKSSHLGEGKFRSLHLGSDHLSTAWQPRWVAWWRWPGDPGMSWAICTIFPYNLNNKDILGGNYSYLPLPIIWGDLG